MFNRSPILVRFCVTVVLAALCNGCATIQKFKCNRMDWASLGLEDGRSGLTRAEAFEERSGTCLEVGATVDEEVYLAGYGEGLAEYCTSDSGFERAIGGERYLGVCPAPEEADFLAGYDKGLEGYCTKESGFAAGSGTREYLEICPVEVQQEFLHGYVAGLDAAVPALDAKISGSLIEVKLAESRLRSLESRISSLGNLRASADDKGDEALVDYYDENLSALNSERFSAESDLRHSEYELTALRDKRASISEWTLKWRASLL